MAVRKLATGKWEADVTVGLRLDGSRDRRREIHPTKAKAEKAESRLKLIKEQKKGKSYGGILFEDFVRDYFWPQKTNLKLTTVKGYKRDLRLRLIPAFGNVPVEEINRYDIQRMISSCATKKVATNARETLSSVLRLAHEMELINVNPASFRYQYPAQSQRDPDAMGEWLTTFDEIKKVLAYLEAHHPGEDVHKICVLGLCFGLRKGEIIAASKPNVHLGQRYLYIDETCTEGEGGIITFGDPKNLNAFREIPIIKLAYDWMEEWSKGKGYIITKHGKPLTPRQTRYALERVFDGVRQDDDGEIMPRITPFSLRHSFATSCVNAGVDETKLFRWMGHSDIKTTKKYYVKQKLKDLTKDAELIDNLI